MTHCMHVEAGDQCGLPLSLFKVVSVRMPLSTIECRAKTLKWPGWRWYRFLIKFFHGYIGTCIRNSTADLVEPDLILNWIEEYWLSFTIGYSSENDRSRRKLLHHLSRFSKNKVYYCLRIMKYHAFICYFWKGNRIWYCHLLQIMALNWLTLRSPVTTFVVCSLICLCSQPDIPWEQSDQGFMIRHSRKCTGTTDDITIKRDDDNGDDRFISKFQ